MREIREPNYHVDLQGEWESEPGLEENATIFRQTDGPGVLTVTLFRVRPMFAIADKRRLVEDYLSHRSTYEASHTPAMALSEPVSWEAGGSIEGSWNGLDPVADHRLRHHVVLVEDVLADLVYEAVGLAEDDFLARADEIFQTVSVIAS